MSPPREAERALVMAWADLLTAQRHPALVELAEAHRALGDRLDAVAGDVPQPLVGRFVADILHQAAAEARRRHRDALEAAELGALIERGRAAVLARLALGKGAQ